MKSKGIIKAHMTVIVQNPRLALKMIYQPFILCFLRARIWIIERRLDRINRM